MENGVVSLADIEQIEETPIEKRLVADNTYDLIRHGVSLDPQAPALSFFADGNAYKKAITYSYAEFLGEVNRTANLFHDLGIGPNDVVSYILPNLPQTHFVLWGGQAAGIVNPINPMLNAEVIQEICEHAKTKVLVALGNLPGSDIWEKVESIRNNLPDLKAIVRVMGPSDEAAGIYGYEETVARYAADKLDSGRKIRSEEIAAIYHTGGTTGTPKLAPHTHFNEVSMVEMVRINFSGLHQGDTFMCGLPLFHVNGTTATGSLPLALGAHILLLSPRGYRDPGVIKNFSRIVEHYRGVFFSAVPTVLAMLLADLDKNADISSLKYLLCGAAPLSVQLFESFEQNTGMKIIEGFGQTEGTCGSIVNPSDGLRKIGSVGLRLPYQQARILILDDDGSFQREAQINEIGTLCISGPNVFPGYLDQSQNQNIWPQPGWLNTGDLARQDEDGYFWLTGRSKDLIIRGGHNIDPGLIEGPAQTMAEVELAAAVGQPDAYAGEVPVVFVQLQKDSQISSTEILGYLADKIGERAAIPKEAFILEQMPLTAVGKIFKPKLRWLAIEHVYRKALNEVTKLVDSFEVSVGENSVYGTLATITAKLPAGIDKAEINQLIADKLGPFMIKYDLQFS
ncbi:MAG TPA: acyl-CoA synthetase [Proteobacteria bacterium]|nr:acyl-CoA synthetase [Pseudomonadota bacterium]